MEAPFAHLPDHVSGDEDCVSAAVAHVPRVRPPPRTVQSLPMLWREAVLFVAAETFNLESIVRESNQKAACKVATDTNILDLRTRYTTKLGWIFRF